MSESQPDAAAQEAQFLEAQANYEQALFDRQQREEQSAIARIESVTAKQKDLGGEDLFTLERFEPHVGSTLEIVAGDDEERIEATIVEAKNPRDRPEDTEFRTPLTVVVAVAGRLEQRFYEVEHPELGTFGMFLVAISQKEDGTVLHEAVYS
ncbi:MAG: hypothetical protein ACI92S_003373 [Planctomycetaceae bacterium]|jgi:hypothetical protein